MIITPANTAPPLVLFIDRGDASYILRDLELLGKYCILERRSFRARSAWPLLFELLRQLFRCVRALRRCEVAIVHFAGWNSILPLLMARLYGKPGLLFLHGTDAVSLPTLAYGNFRKWPLSAVTRHSLRLARKVVVVDRALLASRNTYATEVPTMQGIHAHCPGLATPCEVLPHGFDPEQWPLGKAERPYDVITVGVGLEHERTRNVKGVDLLLAAAKELPHLRFLIVGLPPGASVEMSPNVTCLAAVPVSELTVLYRAAKCYAQLSRSEGFGCALAEAMLSGCVPVVSNVGAMPDIVGDRGVIVNSPVPAAAVRSILIGLQFTSKGGAEHARARIIAQYTLRSREKGLRRILEESLG